jgi:hypothetical protein
VGDGDILHYYYTTLHRCSELNGTGSARGSQLNMLLCIFTFGGITDKRFCRLVALAFFSFYCLCVRFLSCFSC